MTTRAPRASRTPLAPSAMRVALFAGATLYEAVELAPRTWQALRAAATARKCSEPALAARLLSVIARDGLVDAVLDDAQPRAASRKLER